MFETFSLSKLSLLTPTISLPEIQAKQLSSKFRFVFSHFLFLLSQYRSFLLTNVSPIISLALLLCWPPCLSKIVEGDIEPCHDKCFQMLCIVFVNMILCQFIRTVSPDEKCLYVYIILTLLILSMYLMS